MARTDPQLNLRLPAELKEQLNQAAESSGRTTTAETVVRLQRSFAPVSQRMLHERRKVELLASYVGWCDRGKRDPLASFGAFAKAYKDGQSCIEDFDVESVSGIEAVETSYLKELYLTWMLERPAQFPLLADSQSDARRALDLFTLVNLIRAEAMQRGVRVRVTFDANPDAEAELAEDLEVISRHVKKKP